jgi:hypothetical protein
MILIKLDFLGFIVTGLFSLLQLRQAYNIQLFWILESYEHLVIWIVCECFVVLQIVFMNNLFCACFGPFDAFDFLFLNLDKLQQVRQVRQITYRLLNKKGLEVGQLYPWRLLFIEKAFHRALDIDCYMIVGH